MDEGHSNGIHFEIQGEEEEMLQPWPYRTVSGTGALLCFRVGFAAVGYFPSQDRPPAHTEDPQRSTPMWNRVSLSFERAEMLSIRLVRIAYLCESEEGAGRCRSKEEAKDCPVQASQSAKRRVRRIVKDEQPFSKYSEANRTLTVRPGTAK
jgi:hypothetical protein